MVLQTPFREWPGCLPRERDGLAESFGIPTTRSTSPTRTASSAASQREPGKGEGLRLPRLSGIGSSHAELMSGRRPSRSKLHAKLPLLPKQRCRRRPRKGRRPRSARLCGNRSRLARPERLPQTLAHRQRHRVRCSSLWDSNDGDAVREDRVNRSGIGSAIEAFWTVTAIGYPVPALTPRGLVGRRRILC